jgi:hypothetical protein
LFFSDFFFELWPTAGGGGVDTQRCQRSSGGRDEGKGGKARKKGGMNQTHFVKKEELLPEQGREGGREGSVTLLLCFVFIVVAVLMLLFLPLHSSARFSSSLSPFPPLCGKST